MTQEPKEVEQGTLVVVETAWGILDRFKRRQWSRWVDVPRMLQQILRAERPHHHDASELLTKLRAPEGKDLYAP